MVKYLLLVISMLVLGCNKSYTQSSADLDKLQSNSGLMLGTGTVLTATSFVLIGFGANYLKRGNYTETMVSGDPIKTVNGTRNGAILLSTGGVVFAGGLTLLVLGGKMRHEYKLKKETLTVGYLDSACVGVTLTF